MRIALLLALLLTAGSSLAAESFDELFRNASKGVATQSEDAVTALLKAGLEENKTNQAHSVARDWFSQNKPKDPETLHLAAQTAERAGYYPAAVAFYQQYLAKADPKRPESQEVVMRLYRLMVDVMGNENNSAYLYLLNHSEAFIPYGRARQYNTWLLDQAWSNYEATHDMSDFVALLSTVCRSGYSGEEMEAVYEGYFDRLLQPDRKFVGNPGNQTDIALGKAIEELGALITHDQRLKLHLTWLGKIWSYNASLTRAVQNKKNKKETPELIPSPPLAEAEALLSKYPDSGDMVWGEFCGERDDARRWLLGDTGERNAKVALLKKYIKSMPPVTRFKVLRTLLDYDKTLSSGKERDMLNAVSAREWPKGVKKMDGTTPEPERLAEFRTLLTDFDAPTPKLPVVADRLVAIVGCTPAVWPEMMKDDNRQWILYRALEEVVRLRTDTFLYAVDPGSSRSGAPHWAEPPLRGLVEALAKNKELAPWLTQAWINSYKPQWARTQPVSDPAGIPLRQMLATMPQYAALPLTVRRAASNAFGPASPKVAELRNRSNQNHVFENLLALKEDADAAALTAACQTALSRIKDAPTRIAFDRHDELAAFQPAVLEDKQALSLLLAALDNPSTAMWREGGDSLFDRMLERFLKSPDPALIQRHAHMLWLRSVRTYTRTRDGQRTDMGLRNARMLSWIEGLLKDDPSAGATLARAGLHLASVEKGLAEIGGACNAALNRVNATLGIRSIAVDESDPAYPVYKSQNEFVVGNMETAWQLFEENAETAVEMHRKLSAGYWLWVLGRLIDQRNEAGQQRVYTALNDWRSDSATAFSKGQSVMLDVLYGDIARRRGGRDLDSALKIYRGIAEKKEYAGTPEVYTAMLRVIELERITKDFSKALATADLLIRSRVPEFWATARYAKAEVYYDMEDYAGVRELLDEILAREPNHKDAKILEGKVLIKQKSLVDATEILIVSQAVTQNAISPGEWLNVTLTDPTLAIAGGAVDIEVDVWATSGDRETILLAQFGDSKTKFRGRTRVILGAPNPGDGELQVIGDDKIYYAYSKKFMEKVKMTDPKQGGPLTILSDATLMASARKLLTVAEQKQLDAGALLRNMKSGNASESTNQKAVEIAASKLARAGAEREDFDRAAENAEATRAAQTRVKPGNSIYLRVADEDSSRTAGIDAVTVSVEASSGDVVDRVVLKETGTHTGVFEGNLQTGSAQAMAFASSTRTGLNPNMVISPKPYGPWMAASGKGKGTSSLTVDLNDNVPLETLTITASEPGSALKCFSLMAGMNRDHLRSVATWPASPMVDNHLAPSLFMVQQPPVRQTRKVGRTTWACDGNDPSKAYNLEAFSNYLDKEYLVHGPAHVCKVSGPSEAFNKTALAEAPWLQKSRRSSTLGTTLACRFRAYFYAEGDGSRYFSVALGTAPKEVTIPVKHGTKTEELKAPTGNYIPCMVTVNGRPLKGDGMVYEGRIKLRPGLQQIEILSQGNASGIGFGRDCKVATRKSEEDAWTACPDRMFDPSTFPKSARESITGSAKVARNNDGTVYTVSFNEGARARVLSLEFVEHEGPEATLNKLALTAVGGKRVLPVATDFAEIRKNDTLEILSGDRIWVRYVDDRFVNKSKERLERVLNVGFSDAELEFGQVIHGRLAGGILRFQHGEPLSLAVGDPDMDVSDKPDTVTVTLTSKAGGTKTVTLTQGGSSNRNQFIGTVTPVTGRAATNEEFQAAAGDTITMKYWDQENLNPGIPTERSLSIVHIPYQQPTMTVSHMTADVESLTPPAAVQGPKGAGGQAGQQPPIGVTLAPVTMGASEAQIPIFFSGVDAYVDIRAPHLAVNSDSSLRIFVQTETGRKRAEQQRKAAEEAQRKAAEQRNEDDGSPAEKGKGEHKPAPPEPFDVTVPGTRMLTASLVDQGGRARSEDRIHGRKGLGIYKIKEPNLFDSYWRKYENGGTAGVFRAVFGNWPGSLDEPVSPVDTDTILRYATAGSSRPLIEKELGRFRNLVGYSALGSKNWGDWIRTENRCRLLDPPSVKPGEQVYIGLRYEDDKGQTHWLTATARTTTHGRFSVAVERHGESQDGPVALGDRVRVQVLDLGFDASDAQDTVEVQVSSKSGATYPLKLTESAAHSGEYAGSFELTIAQGESPADRNIGVMGFPAAYGDTVHIDVKDSGGRVLPTETFSIEHGSDGIVEPFTKQYGDDDIAIRTQFALAESYLEAAKSYRKVNQEREAVLSYQTAKQLLTTTMDRFTAPEAHAHAEYLLGDLAYEEAGNTKEKDLQEKRYQAALARFGKVAANYPDTPDAPKAQFKTAVTYERLNEPESAAQEYVKLAYKYPDSEYLAVALYRLGAHFRTRAKAVTQELAPLQAQIKDKDPKAVDRDLRFKIDRLAQEEREQYQKAGKIFARVLERFPAHELAGKSGLSSAQCFYAAQDFARAIPPLKVVSDGENYEGVQRAEALYWAGKCYNELGEHLAAYSMFVRCTESFPETEWSGFCLAELTQPRFKEVERGINRERKEKGLTR